jgi:hypothetical protein
MKTSFRRVAMSLLATMPVLFAATHLRTSIANAQVGKTIISANDLWQAVKHTVQHGEIMPGSKAYQPGSRMVDYYTIDKVNKTAYDVIQKQRGLEHVKKYPAGSLLIKENYDQSKRLTGITAMLKEPGFDKADRNWVMAAYGPAGKSISFGKVTSCIQCHEVVNKQDLIFAPPPRQLLPVAMWHAFFPKQKMSPVYLKLLQNGNGQ